MYNLLFEPTMSFEEIFNELILSGISFEDNSSILVTDNKWKNDFYNLVKFNILNNSKVDYVAFLKKPFKFKENLPLVCAREFNFKYSDFKASQSGLVLFVNKLIHSKFF